MPLNELALIESFWKVLLLLLQLNRGKKSRFSKSSELLLKSWTKILGKAGNLVKVFTTFSQLLLNLLANQNSSLYKRVCRKTKMY